MNTDTGKSYIGEAAVTAALTRGERLAYISRKAAESIAAGRRARARELQARRRRNRKRDAIAKASRKANR